MGEARRGGPPNAGQERLLRAALLGPEEAGRAWGEWYAEYGLEAPDEGSFRLLPLVFRNVERSAGGPWPEWEKLRGIYRRAWGRNQWLFHRVRPVLEELAEMGIRPMMLKGAALSARVYPDVGARPMQDVDLMIPRASAAEVFALLERRGWRSKRWRPAEVGAPFFSYTHAMDFESQEGCLMDLHWHALVQCCHAGADEPFWNNAERFEFMGMETLTPGATEQLLQICVHGIVWSPQPSARWVADAVLLVRQERVDWARLAALGEKLDLAPHLEAALSYLQAKWDVRVPEDALKALSEARRGVGTMAEFGRDMEPFAARSAWNDLLAFWGRWRRSLGGASPWVRLPGFARHLQYAFELERMGMLPGQLVRSARRRMR